MTWAQNHQVILDFIQPGQPAQNAYIERFNRTFREEVLDFYLFRSLAELRLITQRWISSYNQERPHVALNGMTPTAFRLAASQSFYFSLVLTMGRLHNNFQNHAIYAQTANRNWNLTTGSTQNAQDPLWGAFNCYPINC